MNLNLKNIFFFFVLLEFISCSVTKDKADLIVHNGNVYTVDSLFTTKQAFAIKDGKILYVGTNEEVLNKYEPEEMLDAEGKTIFPGFIDAHCHFFGYGIGLQQVNLVGTKSFEEVIQRVVDFSKTNKSKWIIGRGWDQNDWDVKEFPNKRKLDSLFPNTSVCLERIDGHAVLANTEAMLLSGINYENTTALCTNKLIKSGGQALFYFTTIPNYWMKPDSREFVKHVYTGILIDNAVDLVKKVIPPPTTEEMKTALLAAQKNCFAAGLTTVDDAGLMKNEIDFIDSLQKSGELKIRIYAMLSDSAPNYDYYLKSGPYKTDRLNVRSFKFYADGALGSRGACLKEDYSDKKGWKGFLLSSTDYFKNSAKKLCSTTFQMNAHCIGDSANHMILFSYLNIDQTASYDGGLAISGKDTIKIIGTGCGPFPIPNRWRIEHAQIVDENDVKYFKNIIPSVQPTHATSDMYWAKDRLGEKRMKYAYAYKTLLKNAGVIALGTDFPVEDISPIKTFYAAVFRKDAKGFPEGGFQMEEALTREETIRGMTIWAAYANFEEKEKGSIEKGKFADFIIMDTDLMKANEKNILGTKVICTYINGEKVYQKN